MVVRGKTGAVENWKSTPNHLCLHCLNVAIMRSALEVFEVHMIVSAILAGEATNAAWVCVWQSLLPVLLDIPEGISSNVM